MTGTVAVQVLNVLLVEDDPVMCRKADNFYLALARLPH